MATAIGVFLLALGAVLAFAVDAAVPGVDLFLVGAILMLFGVAALALSMTRWTPRRRVSVAYSPRPVVPRTVRP